MNEEMGVLPPMASDSEEYLIGAIILEGAKSLPKLIENGVNEDWFYKEAHSKIFLAAKELFDKNADIDVITIMSELNGEGVPPVMLAQLGNKLGTAAHIRTHIALVKDAYVKRLAIEKAMLTKDNCYANNDLGDIISELNENNEKLNELYGGASKAKSIGNLMENSLEQAEERAVYWKQHKTVKGIKTNLRALDKTIYGLQDSKLIILGGRPAMGKTAFAIKLAKESSIGNHVVFFTLEMSEEELSDRLILSNTDINPDNYATGDLKTSDWTALEQSATQLEEHNIHIEDTATMSMDKVKAKAMMYKSKGKCDVIIIDYLQLIDMRTSNKQYNRTNEVGAVSRKAKLLAKELKVPVIMLSQLSRKVEDRGGNKRPLLSDLRESGDIEQDADIVMFCYRPAYYGIDTDDNGEAIDENYFELIVAKNRAGKTGSVRLHHKTGLTDFYDVTSTPPPQMQNEQLQNEMPSNADEFLTPSHSNDEPF